MLIPPSYFGIQKNVQTLNVFFLTLFFLYLEYAYKHLIVIHFERDGYTFTFDFFKYIETKALLILLLIYMHIKKPSDFLYGISYLLLMFLLIPNLIIFEFMNAPRIIIYGIVFTQVLILTIDIGKINFYFPKISVQNQIQWVVILVIALIIPCIMAYGVKNLNYNLLLFEDIYKARAESVEKGTFLTGYFYSWLSKIVLPVLLVYGLMFKKIPIILFSILCLLYLFLAGAHKSVFLTIFAILLLYFYKNYQTKIFYLLASILCLFIISRLVTIHWDNLMMESIVVRRIFFDPAIANIYYFHYFEETPIYLSHSIFKKFIEYPFKETPEKIISTLYFNYSAGSSNNGLISDGFMNFGVIGVFTFGTLFALLIKIFDALHIHLEFPIPVRKQI